MSRAQQIPLEPLGHYAGFVTRLAARLIDQLIIALAGFLEESTTTNGLPVIFSSQPAS